MTKTAILFTGSAYNIRFSIHSAMQNLVIPNNADVFIVTERRCLRRKTVAGEIPDIEDWAKWQPKNATQINDLSQPLTDEEIQLIKDVLGDRLKMMLIMDDDHAYYNYICSKREKMRSACNEYRNQSLASGVKPPFNDIHDSDNGNIRCVVDQYHHVKKAYYLMCEYESKNDFKYDYVMRARIDFFVPEKISVEYYTLNHDKAYWYIMGSVNRDPFPYAEEFCWFSKRSICDGIYPQLERLGTITDRKYETFYAPQNNDFRFCAETQFALLIKELSIPYINVKIYRSSKYTNGGDGFDYMNYKYSRAKINVEDEYQLACQCESDINEHLPVLRKYAEKCTHITEMGTRYGNSTIAFMSSYPQKFISYDVTPNDKIEYLQIVAKDSGINFEFRNENVEQIEIEETDLLFIDTNHHEEQCSNELKLHAHKARKYMIFHDCVTFWEDGQGWWKGEGHGLRYAIEPFLETHPEWEIAEFLKNNNGLLILKRVGV
jgi:cephalosporin hydroxylase